jgi:hypothetical protein
MGTITEVARSSESYRGKDDAGRAQNATDMARETAMKRAADLGKQSVALAPCPACRKRNASAVSAYVRETVIVAMVLLLLAAGGGTALALKRDDMSFGVVALVALLALGAAIVGIVAPLGARKRYYEIPERVRFTDITTG